MILIVESGSTKADWLLIDDHEIITSFQSKGWNPIFLLEDDMNVRLNSYSKLNPFLNSIKEVYFYTPGCSHLPSKNMLHNFLELFFTNSKIFLESDLCAAVRSAYKGDPLFVSILGTGSNTAFFDGDQIQQFRPSLGYVMGDEGSGASLGKILLRDYLYKKLPNDLYLYFSKQYSISSELVIDSVYKKDHPNQFLSSYVPFLVDHQKHPYINNIVAKEFQSYIENHLLSNPMCLDYPISFIGSVSYLFREVLTNLCANYNLKIQEFIKSPITSLHHYHIMNKKL